MKTYPVNLKITIHFPYCEPETEDEAINDIKDMLNKMYSKWDIETEVSPLENPVLEK